MKLDIKPLVAQDIRKQPIQCEIDLHELEWNNEYPFVEPVKASGFVGVFAGIAELVLNVDVTLKKHCDRCYTLVEKQESFSFRHEIRPDGSTESEEVPIENGVLDLDDLIAQDILLEMPIRFLCREECDGLLLID